MPRLIKDRITVSDGRIYFDFKLREPITLVDGDSATGKTLFFKMYQKEVALEHIDDVLFLNLSSANTAEPLIKLTKNKLIIIDNADIVLTDKLALSLRKDKYNQYIIFGRDIERYGVDRRSIASLSEYTLGHIELEYDIAV